MSTSPTSHRERERSRTDAQQPATHNAATGAHGQPPGGHPTSELPSNALASALERRIAELSEQLHAMTTERSILADELRLMRAGQKSAAEITATLAMRRISM